MDPSWPGTWYYAFPTTSTWTISTSNTTATLPVFGLGWGTTWVSNLVLDMPVVSQPSPRATEDAERRRFYAAERARQLAEAQAVAAEHIRARWAAEFAEAEGFTAVERQMLIEECQLRIAKPATRRRPARVYVIPTIMYDQVRIDTPEGEWIETVCTQPDPSSHLTTAQWVRFQKLLIEGAEAFYLRRGHHYHNPSYQGQRVCSYELPAHLLDAAPPRVLD